MEDNHPWISGEDIHKYTHICIIYILKNPPYQFVDLHKNVKRHLDANELAHQLLREVVGLRGERMVV